MKCPELMCCGSECAHGSNAASQSLAELDFSRGLWKAAADGDADRMELILLNRTDVVNKQDSGGYCAIHYAAGRGHLAACELLVQHGCNVNIQTRSGRATALHRAATMGHRHVAKFLITAGAKPAILDADHRNALHRAAETGDKGCIQIVMAADSTLTQQHDSKGRRPVDCLPTSASHDLVVMFSP